MNIQNLFDTLAVQSASYKNELMMEYIIKRLNAVNIPHFRDAKGNLYAVKGELAEGEAYPCAVAHTDTVHKIHPDYAIFNINGHAVAFNGPDQVGTGGDDKVGIFAALELLETFPVFKVAFFVDEEVGCQGSRNSDKPFFIDVGYILQADRRGNEDIIDAIGGKKLCSAEFKTAMAPQVEAHKRKWCSGMTTDVGALADFHKISMMNMSCGYHLPHSDREYVTVQDVENTFNFMHDVVIALGNKAYPCEHENTWVSYNSTPRAFPTEHDTVMYKTHTWVKDYSGWVPDALLDRSAPAPKPLNKKVEVLTTYKATMPIHAPLAFLFEEKLHIRNEGLWHSFEKGLYTIFKKSGTGIISSITAKPYFLWEKMDGSWGIDKTLTAPVVRPPLIISGAEEEEEDDSMRSHMGFTAPRLSNIWQKVECPKCFRFEMQYDEAQDDYYCLSCKEYEEDMYKQMERSFKQTVGEHKKTAPYVGPGDYFNYCDLEFYKEHNGELHVYNTTKEEWKPLPQPDDSGNHAEWKEDGKAFAKIGRTVYLCLPVNALSGVVYIAIPGKKKHGKNKKDEANKS